MGRFQSSFPFFLPSPYPQKAPGRAQYSLAESLLRILQRKPSALELCKIRKLIFEPVIDFFGFPTAA